MFSLRSFAVLGLLVGFLGAIPAEAQPEAEKPMLVTVQEADSLKGYEAKRERWDGKPLVFTGLFETVNPNPRTKRWEYRLFQEGYLADGQLKRRITLTVRVDFAEDLFPMLKNLSERSFLTVMGTGRVESPGKLRIEKAKLLRAVPATK